MGSKGSQTTTNSTTTAPDAQAMGAYSNVLNQAQGVAATPYQAYGGEGVAPFNAQQNTAVAGINQYANAAQPAISSAMTQAQAASAPITQQQIQQYMSPYTQNVVNATQAQFNNQNQQQQQGVVGNAIAQGALGGNRSAIAQSEMANQQQLAQAPVIAQLQNQGYTTGLNTALSQQQAGMQGANLTAQLGVAGQSAGLSGAGAQFGVGQQQQQTQQALDAYNQQQYAQQQAYPFQTTQWLAGLDTGVGSQMGGTSSGQTTAPAPSIWGQALGGLTSGVGLLGATGAFGSTGWMMSDKHVKENIHSVGKTHDGQTIYIFNYKGHPQKQIGLMAQDVEKKHPEAVHDINGIKHVDYEAATEDAIRKRAMGGGIGYAAGGSPGVVAGTPWANAPSWIPGNNIAHGAGAPHASAPAPYNPPANDLSKQAASIGDLAKQLTNGVNGGTPGSAVSGDTGPSSYGGANGPTPLVGVAPYGGADYQNSTGNYNGMSNIQQDTLQDMGGLARGGVVGYADGGSPTYDPSDDDRSLGYDLLRQGMGVKAPDSIPGGEPAPKEKPVVFGPDGKMLGNQTSEQGVEPSSNVLDDPVITDTPPSKSRSVAPTTAMAYSGQPPKSSDDSLPPEVALGYSKGVAPANIRAANETDSTQYDRRNAPSGPNFGSDSKLWPALMSAGLGMMASRSPFLGVAIGEGGQAGMAQYGAQTKAEQEAKEHAQKLQLEREQLERPYSEMTMAQKAADKRANSEQLNSQANQAVIIGPNGKPMVNPTYVAAKEAVEKSFKPTWGQIDEMPSGQKIMGWVDPNTKKVFDAQGNPYTPRNPAAVTAPVQPQTTDPTKQPPPLATPKTAAEAASTPTPPPTPAPSAPPHPADTTAPAGSDASRNTAYLSQIQAQEPAYAAAIKKAADYELDPAKFASMRADHRQKFIQDVLAYDPSYNPQDVGLRYKAQAAFLPGTKTGDTVRSFNTAVAHLDTLKELYTAVNNGDVKLFNKIKNEFQSQFGYAPPNTLNGVAQIVAGEVVKATVGSQNALGDREELRKTVDRDLSTMQATDVINKFQSLMGGQLHSLKFAYEQGTGLHNFDEKYLLPRSREVLNHIDKGAPAAVAKPSLDEFLTKAHTANPTATNQQLTDYYNKKYGTQ